MIYIKKTQQKIALYATNIENKNIMKIKCLFPVLNRGYECKAVQTESLVQPCTCRAEQLTNTGHQNR